MAKLRPEQLDSQLQGQLAPVYLVSGEEPLLVQEACDRIRAAARARGFERELFYADANFDWTQLLSAANSLSLFAEQKLLEVRLPSAKPGDKGSKALVEYAQNPSPDNLLLVVTGKLERSQQSAKWFRALDQLGVQVTVWPVLPAQMPRWIGQRLKAAGLNADSSAIELLASRVEGNLLAAAQEIEKLTLLAADTRTIDAHLMASVVAESARYDIFGLVDRALHGDARMAVKSLQGLRLEGTDPITLLWALARDIRALLQISQAMAQGQSFERAADQAKIWAKRRPLLQAALRRLPGSQLEQLLRKANGVDKAIKGMRQASPWDELMDLVLSLAGVQSLQKRTQRLALTL